MDELSDQEWAVELLQHLGLKEYEARCFVALTRLPKGTAKEISDVSEVPRTRVYDAIRVLETKGLVEVQHSNPQQFRAVSIDEAAETLRSEYDERIASLREALGSLEGAPTDDEVDVTHEVWALSGGAAITTRTQQLIDEAEEELVVVVGGESVFTEDLVDSIEAARGREVDLVVGTASEGLREAVDDALPEIQVFVSGLEWLGQSTLPGDETAIGRLVLVDRTTILVSSYVETDAGEREHEKAVFGRGFDNGLVAIVRRLMATGLSPGDGAGPEPR